MGIMTWLFPHKKSAYNPPSWSEIQIERDRARGRMQQSFEDTKMAHQIEQRASDMAYEHRLDEIDREHNPHWFPKLRISKPMECYTVHCAETAKYLNSNIHELIRARFEEIIKEDKIKLDQNII